MNPLSLLSGAFGAGGSGGSPGVGNVGDGGTGKSSAVAKTTFGDRITTTDNDQRPQNNTPLYVVAGVAAVALVTLVLLKH
jgi:hypothetical protein